VTRSPAPADVGGAAAPLAYDPYDAGVMADPYPVYRRLRDEDPVHRLIRPGDGGTAWAVSRMDDVWSCFSRPDVFSNRGGITGSQLLERRMGPYAALGNLDPPVHTARRSAVKGWFTPGRVRGLRTLVRDLCRDRLVELRAADRFDAVVDYGLYLSVSVVCELLAVPGADRPLLEDWVRTIFYRPPGDVGLTTAGADAYGAILAYCAAHAHERRQRGWGRTGRTDGPAGAGPDLLDGYLALAREQGLDDDDLASHLREVVIGGSETNPKALGAAVHRLATRPDQRAEVARQPGLAARAFNEALRIDTPGQFMGRTVVEETHLHDRVLGRGDVVLLLIASANRDEREHPDPDVYDVHRSPGRSVGFGQGTHYCIGRHVAGLEGEVAVQELLAVAPGYGLDLESATRTRHEMVHGFTSLPVVWS
jgi:cytochrome P450